MQASRLFPEDELFFIDRKYMEGKERHTSLDAEN